MNKPTLVSIVNKLTSFIMGESVDNSEMNINQLEERLASCIDVVVKNEIGQKLIEENLQLKQKLQEAQEALVANGQVICDLAEKLENYESGDDTTDIGTGMPKPKPHITLAGSKLALTKAIRVIPQDRLWERLAVNQDGKRFSVWFHQDFYLLEGSLGTTGKPTKRPRPEAVQFLARLKERGEQLGLQAFFTPDHLVIIAK